jgi:hypothetical protein
MDRLSVKTWQLLQMKLVSKTVDDMSLGITARIGVVRADTAKRLVHDFLPFIPDAARLEPLSDAMIALLLGYHLESGSGSADDSTTASLPRHQRLQVGEVVRIFFPETRNTVESIMRCRQKICDGSTWIFFCERLISTNDAVYRVVAQSETEDVERGGFTLSVSIHEKIPVSDFGRVFVHSSAREWGEYSTALLEKVGNQRFQQCPITHDIRRLDGLLLHIRPDQLDKLTWFAHRDGTYCACFFLRGETRWVLIGQFWYEEYHRVPDGFVLGYLELDEQTARQLGLPGHP